MARVTSSTGLPPPPPVDPPLPLPPPLPGCVRAYVRVFLSVVVPPLTVRWRSALRDYYLTPDGGTAVYFPE